MATPISVEHLGRVGSTQDEARSRFAGIPILVTATGQDAGRGRSGASWLDADRSLAASVALAPGWDAESLPKLMLVAGLAALDVLPSGIGLKWPNDLVREGIKVGGMLAEAAADVVVIGLGLNVYWESPPSGMGGLHVSDPGPGHAPRLAEHWAGAVLERVARGPDDWGREEYLRRCVTIGTAITWAPEGAGMATGVGEDGSLLVDTGAGRRRLHSGAITEVRSRGSGTLPAADREKRERIEG
ncbi:MAG: hypothetical protein V3V29_03520 [Acidimicrobiia bacterium]